MTFHSGDPIYDALCPDYTPDSKLTLCARGSPAGDGRGRARAEDQRIECEPAERVSGGRGGTAEESAKAQNSVLVVVPVMLALMVTMLMIQLQGFSNLFLVLS